MGDGTPNSVPTAACTYTILPMTRVYRLDSPERERIVAELTKALEARTDVVFAVMFGSFHRGEPFRDIDVGMWAGDAAERDLDLELAVALSRLTGFPVDVRRLNDAPVPYLFHALRGRILAVRDEELLANLMERVARDYHDREPLLRRATREAFTR